MIYKIAKTFVFCAAIAPFSARAMDFAQLLALPNNPLSPLNNPQVFREGMARTKKICSLEESVNPKEKENLEEDLALFGLQKMAEGYQRILDAEQRRLADEQRVEEKAYQKSIRVSKAENLARKNNG